MTEIEKWKAEGEERGRKVLLSEAINNVMRALSCTREEAMDVLSGKPWNEKERKYSGVSQMKL